MLSVLVHGQRLWTRAAGLLTRRRPEIAKLVGIELRTRVARLAQQALDQPSKCFRARRTHRHAARADAVLFFDVCT